MTRQIDTATIGCEEFPEGTLWRRICEGTANMHLRKLNVYRAHKGWPPLEGEDEPAERKRKLSPRKTREKKPRSSDPASVNGSPVHRARRSGGCSSCGGKKTKLEPNGYGPGSKLLEIFKKMDIPHCPACLDLAAQMDAWGKRGCAERIDGIVNDVFPRAETWVREHAPVRNFLGVVTGIKSVAIRTTIAAKVAEAIEKAEDPPRRSSRRRAGRRVKQPAGPCSTSNLISSTAIGQPTWTIGDFTKVNFMPFTREPTRNLIYHIYPSKCDDIWKRNLDLVLKYIGLFDGRRVVAIATDKDSASAEEVQDHLGGEVLEYMVYRNNPKAGEMVSFMTLLSQVESHEPNEVTFRAHAKGVNRVCAERKKRHIWDWVEMLYHTNLGDWPLVKEHLESAALTGSCRKFDMFRKQRRDPVYSGSFYWFRNCWVFSRDWYRIDGPRWGCESWPGKHFSEQETRCLFLDSTGSMYSPEYWENKVKPAYDNWLRDRGIVV